MAYAEYMRSLLRPLGVYALTEGSLSGGELEALGAAFDGLYQKMQKNLREALPITAEEEGLAAYEALLRHPHRHLTVAQRQAAVCGLLRLHGGGADAKTITEAAAFVGAEISFDESTLPESLGVTLQELQDSELQRRIERYLELLLPSHLEMEYHAA